MPVISCKHVSFFGLQTLHALHQAQFRKCVGADVAVCTDPEPPTGILQCAKPENAVTKIAFRARA